MAVAIIVAVVLVLSVIFLTLSFFIGRKFAKTVVYPRVHTPEDSRQRVIEKTGKDPKVLMDGHKVESFTYRSEFGYDLKGMIIRADEKDIRPDKRQRVVILSHGWTSDHMTMFTYGKLYQELGFSIVAYDHRYHGYSDNDANKTFCTMGLCESRDLIGVFNQLKPTFPGDTIWGLQGESMGAATAMQAAPDMDGISFLVEDCGYSSLRKQMAHSLERMHLPKFPILNFGSLVMKRLYGLDMNKVNAAEAMAKLDIPVLFCQGDNDTFVPTKFIYDVFNAKKDKKRMKLFEGSKHAESIWDHPDLYKETLESFLKEYDLL